MGRLLFFCVFLACARPEQPADFRVRIAAVGPLEPLAPGLAEGFSSLINPLVFQPLVTPTREREWRSPVLSKIRRIDSERYRVQLLSSATFSDGASVRDEDIHRAFGGRASVTAKDGEFELELTKPHGTVELFEAVISKSTQLGFVGTGPFSIINQSNQSILLRRRNPDRGRVHEVELITFPTPRDAFAAALRGDVNTIIMPSEGEVELLRGVRSLQVIRGRGLQSLAVVFNSQRLSTAERRALARSLPATELAHSFNPRCSSRRRDNGEPVEAGRALDIAAYDGFQAFRPTALSLRRSLGTRAGRISFVQDPSELQSASRGAFDLTLALAQNWPTETALARWLTGAANNWGAYSNPKFDEAFRAGDFVRAQAELDADPPAAFICDLDRTAIVDSRIKNATLGDYDLLDTLPEWEVTP